ncbi:DNA-binding transcriptional regulator, MarR family [Clostridium cavendishii DSM 21758]|uniref:DNA-binding transcriptional regulator, MarR family n=1 Tax=Clostridium cavendishii DSM 21758 TaxID=1121302 RepID=A0A1M6CX69_9CLOT|nr:MarR family transcriptional regulator [Clostridium cavendishii]SHI65540.1 DNA-binding transcriptional regulator, MarR family [Clostridium cavendishii DSM 21758]
MKCFNDDSLYSVFYRVIKLHYRTMHGMLDKIGIYPGQPPVLFSLYFKDGQSQKELADKIKVKPATITVMLSRMEKAELVTRKPDKDDQRVSRVFITDKGRETCEKVKEITKEAQEICFKNFTQEELIIIRRLFMQMKDNLLEVVDEDIKF